MSQNNTNNPFGPNHDFADALRDVVATYDDDKKYVAKHAAELDRLDAKAEETRRAAPTPGAIMDRAVALASKERKVKNQKAKALREIAKHDKYQNEYIVACESVERDRVDVDIRIADGEEKVSARREKRKRKEEESEEAVNRKKALTKKLNRPILSCTQQYLSTSSSAVVQRYPTLPSSHATSGPRNHPVVNPHVSATSGPRNHPVVNSRVTATSGPSMPAISVPNKPRMPAITSGASKPVPPSSVPNKSATSLKERAEGEREFVEGDPSLMDTED